MGIIDNSYGEDEKINIRHCYINFAQAQVAINSANYAGIAVIFQPAKASARSFLN